MAIPRPPAPQTGPMPTPRPPIDEGSAGYTAEPRAAAVISPEDFVKTGRRLFLDTNVFMDTDTLRSAGLKMLFERCKDLAIRNGNGIVVPSKVIDELASKAAWMSHCSLRSGRPLSDVLASG